MQTIFSLRGVKNEGKKLETSFYQSLTGKKVLSCLLAHQDATAPVVFEWSALPIICSTSVTG